MQNYGLISGTGTTWQAQPNVHPLADMLAIGYRARNGIAANMPTLGSGRAVINVTALAMLILPLSLMWH